MIVYTRDQIYELVNRIEQFNAGAIDQQLSRHINEQYKMWLDNTTPVRMNFFQWLRHRFGRR